MDIWRGGRFVVSEYWKYISIDKLKNRFENCTAPDKMGTVAVVKKIVIFSPPAPPFENEVFKIISDSVGNIK